jgi:hypothetical protein
MRLPTRINDNPLFKTEDYRPPNDPPTMPSEKGERIPRKIRVISETKKP